MKICGKCKIDQPVENYNWRSKIKGTLNTWCKDCYKAYDRTRYTTTDRSVTVRENTKLYVDRNRLFFFDILKKSSCIDCGETDYRVLHFDHRPEEVKLSDVTKLVNTGSSLETIQKEIDKCDCRCANHHMIITAERGGWWRASLSLDI